jgi:hypothetical protein
MTRPQVVACAALAVLVALYVVGAVSIPPGSLRHEVQTLPLWIPIVAGFRGREIAKWAVLPCLLFWLTIMVFIWLFLLFLLGWARIVTGRFFPTEVAMTIVVGLACVTGLGASLRLRTSTTLPVAIATFAGMTALQFLAFRISLIPYIGSR